MKAKKTYGFTLIELLVVIAIIALLLSIIMPALGKAKELAQKVICRSNIRQQCLGVLLYAGDNNTEVPTSTAGNWLWDVSFWTTNQVSDYAGITENDVFYCPANRIKTAEDARFWQFTWLDGGANTSQVVPIRDESGLNVNQLKTNFRVMPNLWMFYSNSNKTPDILNQSNLKAKWITKISDLQNTASVIMIMDNVIESAQQRGNFFEIPDGGVTAWGLVDNSNHASRQRYNNTNYYQPSGANTGYADGHVDWRDFDKMKPQMRTGPYFWW